MPVLPGKDDVLKWFDFDTMPAAFQQAISADEFPAPYELLFNKQNVFRETVQNIFVRIFL